MRVLRWVLAGLAVGVAVGILAGLLRSRPPSAYSSSYTSLTEDTAGDPTTAARPEGTPGTRGVEERPLEPGGS
jgi:hypothetical protein